VVPPILALPDALQDRAGIAHTARGRIDLVCAAIAAGFERLTTPPAGETIVIPQFIHYHLEGGKFARALCAIV
jgi:hypothetical protein